MKKIFISHASEDKDFARPLAQDLRKRGIEVWFDEFSLQVGDSLRESIDKGLIECDFGIVIFSKNFFKKNWTTYELNSLNTIEQTYSRKVILPIWHGINHNDVVKYSPYLADKVALNSNAGIQQISDKIELTCLNKDISVHYDLNTDKNLDINWGKFNSSLIFENITLAESKKVKVWNLRAEELEDVGINLFFLPIKGMISFEYKIKECLPNAQNLTIYLIPMSKTNEMVEVGFSKPVDKRNQHSFLRQRFRIKNVVNTWVKQEIRFSFEDLLNTEYVIFAPRINEGSAIKGRAEFRIRNVVCVKTIDNK